MQPLKVTLDTNIILEYWKHQKRRDVVAKLLELARSGSVELAVTARIRQDIPDEPISSRINDLPELDVVETGSVARLGYWQLGIDQLGDDDFVIFATKVAELAATTDEREPDWRDWDHLHAHYLQGRDAFLTWDRAILTLAAGLASEFGIVVETPEQFIRRMENSSS